MKVQNPAILIVEDDANDQFLIRNAFKKIGVRTPLEIVNNGQEAIDYLNGVGVFADRKEFPFPTTIITDLKMPVMDGFSVLQHLKQNQHWAVVPIIVLSASADLNDIQKAYMLGAAAYHVKPSNADALRNLLKTLHDYWLLCEIPESDKSGRQLHTDGKGKLGERFSE